MLKNSKNGAVGIPKNGAVGDFLVSTLPNFLASPSRSILVLRILVMLFLVLFALFRYFGRKTETETEIIDGMEVPVGSETYNLNID